MTNLKCRFRI